MLSVKRLFQIIIIILLISVGLLFYNINSMNKISAEAFGRMEELKQPLFEIQTLPESKEAFRFLVVGEPSSTYESTVQTNILETLASMKVTYTKKKSIVKENLRENPVLIFCVTDPGGAIELALLADFIEDGGKAIFAAGIPEYHTASYLYPIWGISEKGVLIASNEFHMFDNFMPYGEITFPYDGYNASTTLRLSEGANVYVEDLNRNPIVYENLYEEGKVIVINGTLLDNKDSMGILCASVSKLVGEFLYPVTGTKTVILEDFPPSYLLDGRTNQRLYGRSGESFLRDILWPALLSYSSNYNMKYTGIMYEILENGGTSYAYNSKLTSYLAQELYKYSGEIIYSERESSALFSITSGLQPEESSFIKYLTNLILRGQVFHNINFRQLLQAKTEETGWEAVKEGFSRLVKNYFETTTWLTATTYSEGYEHQIAYEQLELVIEYNDKNIQTFCSDFLDGQAFYLYSDKKVKEVIGGSFYPVNDSYYFIQAKEAHFIIVYEE
ncbi:MAG: hypothetical protein K0R21_842 [Anaerocolumna sp.]|nr:hypothetical protein [Anaerocolumna sp.]